MNLGVLIERSGGYFGCSLKNFRKVGWTGQFQMLKRVVVRLQDSVDSANFGLIIESQVEAVADCISRMQSSSLFA